MAAAPRLINAFALTRTRRFYAVSSPQVNAKTAMEPPRKQEIGASELRDRLKSAAPAGVQMAAAYRRDSGCQVVGRTGFGDVAAGACLQRRHGVLLLLVLR